MKASVRVKRETEMRNRVREKFLREGT